LAVLAGGGSCHFSIFAAISDLNFCPVFTTVPDVDREQHHHSLYAPVLLVGASKQHSPAVSHKQCNRVMTTWA
jgi:hypothetical protein